MCVCVGLRVPKEGGKIPRRGEKGSREIVLIYYYQEWRGGSTRPARVDLFKGVTKTLITSITLMTPSHPTLALIVYYKIFSLISYCLKWYYNLQSLYLRCHVLKFH